MKTFLAAADAIVGNNHKFRSTALVGMENSDPLPAGTYTFMINVYFNELSQSPAVLKQVGLGGKNLPQKYLRPDSSEAPYMKHLEPKFTIKVLPMPKK